MANQAQIDYWNGEQGNHWAKQADGLDAALHIFGDTMLSAADLEPGETVMDVGCGAGAVSLAAQELVGPNDPVTGVDVSKPLLTLARKRAEALGLPTRFEQADASEWQNPHPADVMVSRFGVMFFEDPAAAFANIRKQIKPGGRLCFVCWRDLRESRFMTLPMDALKPHLKEELPRPDPEAPGPGAFADKDRLNRILTEAGWRNIAVDPYDGMVTPPGDTVPAAADFVLGLTSIVRKTMAEQGIDEAPVRAGIEKTLEEHWQDGGAKLSGATWIVTARA